MYWYLFMSNAECSNITCLKCSTSLAKALPNQDAYEVNHIKPIKQYNKSNNISCASLSPCMSYMPNIKFIIK